MTKEEQDILHTFEARVRTMILEYNAVSERNYILESQINQLKKDQESLKQDLMKSQEMYANLKIAKMIEINDDEMKNARSRLSKLVREIDKCIALLNV